MRAIILATGFQAFDAARIPNGYGKYAHVYTSLELERLSERLGPHGREIVLATVRSPSRWGSCIAWARATRRPTTTARGSAACIR